ncbi:uncharacterized protein LOC143555234 [Bidens hawaiensis]|uniref:uncharacterized protein LOC143555234 n=1 Tax=Bidens hawaiensis TaxID=980011 RepID=UPI00404B5740
MNHCGIQQVVDGDLVVCPKPRRLSYVNSVMYESVWPLRWQMCYKKESCVIESGPELLDLILAKSGGHGALDQTCTNIASSPPFFCGSPPSRVSNPLIQDARFGDNKVPPVSPEPVIINPTSGMSSSSSWKVGYPRPSYGNKPAVRIEGFDCLDRDNRRNRSVPALA